MITPIVVSFISTLLSEVYSPLLQVPDSAFQSPHDEVCISRHHDIFSEYFSYGSASSTLLTITQFYKSLRMQVLSLSGNKRTVKLFTQFKAVLKNLLPLHCPTVQSPESERPGNHPRILFVLENCKVPDHRNYKNKSSVYSHIRNRIQRICRHIQTDMLHACHRTYSGKTCADRNLCRHFFIRRPLFIHIFFLLYKIFADLGTWSSRISRRYLYPCFISSSGNRLISQHDHFLFMPYQSPSFRKSVTLFAFPSNRLKESGATSLIQVARPSCAFNV